MSQCKFIGCGKVVQARGLCLGHYAQWRKEKPLTPLKRHKRFLSIRDKLEDDISNHAHYVDRGYKTPCLEMVEHIKSPREYEKFQFQGKFYLQHREVYFLSHPEISREYLVCHHCDNRRCFRVDHLFHGTPQDNSTDAVKKGRIRKGERHGMAKFPDSTIKKIRSLHKTGLHSQQEIGETVGMSQKYVSDIIRGHRRASQP